jgi:hypothetical protein
VSRSRQQDFHSSYYQVKSSLDDAIEFTITYCSSFCWLPFSIVKFSNSGIFIASIFVKLNGMAEENKDVAIKEEEIDLEVAAKKKAEDVIKRLEKETGKSIPDELREKHFGYRNIKHIRTFIERGHEYNANLFLRQCMRDLKLEMMEKGVIPRPPPKLTSGQGAAKATGVVDYYNIHESTLMRLSKN